MRLARSSFAPRATCRGLLAALALVSASLVRPADARAEDADPPAASAGSDAGDAPSIRSKTDPAPTPRERPPDPSAANRAVSDATATVTGAGPEGTKTPRVQLRYNLWIDVPVTVGLAAGILAWGFIKPSLGNRTCTICDGPGTDVNALDDFFRTTFVRQDIGPSATISHVISYGVSPVAGVALAFGVAAADRRANEAPVNALLVLEASVAAVVVKEMITAAIRRERPQVHALEGDAKQKEIDEQSDPLESFPSGHVASIMAITASSAVIATMRGYKLAPVIWIVGSTLAGVVTYLRMAADQHYFTDNLVGAAIGTGVGAAVPLLFHRPVASTPDKVGALPSSRPMLSTMPVQGGHVVNVGWAW